MIFTYLSAQVDPEFYDEDCCELATGIGFLGAGIILKSEANERVTNLTTAPICFAAAIGMAIGLTSI